MATSLEVVPRVRLALLPTPLHEASRLRAQLGGARRCPRILLKRDDMTDVALGGNKARKLEYLVADALAAGATVMVTTGGPQSNHARMTAAAARMAGLRAVLVLTYSGPAPDRGAGNLLLDRILGAEVHLVPDVAGAEAAKLAEVVAALDARGERPYVVPLGGSNGIGALGYVEATRELVTQLADSGARAARLYHASGSRGTQAGLELGARLHGASWRVHGVAVSGGEEQKRARAVAIMAEAAALLGTDVAVREDELLTEQSYYGAGYAIPTASGVEAIRLLARTEGVFLDPVYTAKAMAGMLDHIRRGFVEPSETVVFLHTGGAPGLFAQAGRVIDMLGDPAAEVMP
jgi:D-cysteine desulfhydrase family pyridoxal phosphate-dependent enzyme